MVTSTPTEQHYGNIVEALQRNKLVFFFGAGVNMANRPVDFKWQPACDYLPSGGELSEYLAEQCKFPLTDSKDLLRVSQYLHIEKGDAPLFDRLRDLFNRDYAWSVVHEFVASLPGLLRGRRPPGSNLMIVTTNYDDLMEKAFAHVGEQFDLITYIVDGDDRGLFRHTPPDGGPIVIRSPNDYLGASLEKRHVILKIHGSIDRRSSAEDSFAITEDHYIDYLARADISNVVPAVIAQELRNRHLLFLGYQFRDWNLRVVLRRIWANQRRKYNSWAVQRRPLEVDCKYWMKHDIELLDASLSDYIAELKRRFLAAG